MMYFHLGTLGMFEVLKKYFKDCDLNPRCVDSNVAISMFAMIWLGSETSGCGKN